MGVMSSVISFVIKAGIKFITGLIQFAVKLTGTPGTRMPTEEEVVCEFGSALFRKIVKTKTKQKCTALLSTFRKLLPGLTRRKQPTICTNTKYGLVIDI